MMTDDDWLWEAHMVQPDMGGRHQYHLGPRKGPGGVGIRCTADEARNVVNAVNYALGWRPEVKLACVQMVGDPPHVCGRTDDVQTFESRIASHPDLAGKRAPTCARCRSFLE
jgi:hypothetical protein